MRTPDRRRYHVALQSEGKGPPADIRLRRLLKAALRSFGLRVVDVRAVDETNEQPQPEGDNP